MRASTTVANENPAPGPADDFAALAMMAGLRGTDAHGIELLKIITNPEHNHVGLEGETPMEIADTYEEGFGGYQGGDANWEVQTIADFLYAHYAAHADLPDFGFGLEANAEGEIGSYYVSATFGTDWNSRVVLSGFHEIKHSTHDRDATGLAAALAIAAALDADYQSLLATGRKRGLMAADPDVVGSAVAALAALDTVPDGGSADIETLDAVRASLAALIAAQGTPVTGRA